MAGLVVSGDRNEFRSLAGESAANLRWAEKKACSSQDIEDNLEMAYNVCSGVAKRASIESRWNYCSNLTPQLRMLLVQ